MWRGDSKNPVPNIGNVKSDLSQNIAQQSSVLSEKKTDINRAEQVRRDTDKQKDNTVKLVDVDNAIMRQLQKFQLTVTDEGNKIIVPIYYASPEKWKSIQADGVMRDYNGKILLPAIVFQRTTSEKDTMMMMFNRYLTYPVIRLYSEKNRYTRFRALIGQNVPVHEVYDVVMPDHMVFTYHFIVWTEYIEEQMNTIIERLNFETEDYWGDLRGLRFRTRIDSFSHAVELQVDQDRMVKTEFDLLVNAYLLPDIIDRFQGKRNTTQKRFIPKKVVMGVEVVSTDFVFDQNLDNTREKFKSQTYPNIPADTVIEPPPISFPIIPKFTIDQFGKQVIESIWHLPAPQNSSDLGDEGWISFDDDYYYIRTVGKWKRAPITLVNSVSLVVGEKKWTSYDNDYIYMSGSIDRIPISLFNNY